MWVQHYVVEFIRKGMTPFFCIENRCERIESTFIFSKKLWPCHSERVGSDMRAHDVLVSWSREKQGKERSLYAPHAVRPCGARFDHFSSSSSKI